ncbi:hypothetical protein BJV74DRAFT_838710 [Russula compacta]|nr:hypothetical protein BJV74DRAFT_838710 [Russula compacta]
MAHYHIFRQELAIKYPAYGHALWEPSPGNLYPTVEIGDVGFIRQGKFHRLFNALLPGDHPSHQNFGVPEHYEPLQLNMPWHVDTGMLSPNNFRSVGVMAVSSGDGVFASGPDPESKSFSCSRKVGAILSLPVPALRQDTLALGDFGKWIVSHIDHWFAFTQRLGLGITRMEDIVLVTGCHLAKSWANIVFLEGRGEERVSFGVQVSGVSNVEWQFTPEDVQGVASNLGPSGQDLPENQCIFVRGFRVARLLRILPRLRAAAEPTQSSDENEPEPESDTQLMGIPTETNYQDPLHTLLGYIATSHIAST